MTDFERYDRMVIDFHTHMFPDKLAKKTIPMLSEISGFKNQTDGTLSGTLASMNENGVDMSVVCNIATNPHQTENVNNFAIEINKNPRIISFGSVHPECEDYIYHLDKLKDNGIKGIKLHPDYQSFFIDEPRMQPLYEAILKCDFVLIFHSGVDDGIGEPVHSTPERVKNIMSLLRGEKVVLAHMGSFKMWDEVCESILTENVYFDVSCAVQFLENEKFSYMIKTHGTEKILFASDLPWTLPSEGIEVIKNLDISEEDKEKIFSENAKKLLNL